MFFIQVRPVIDLRMQTLCRYPYYNHLKGCPNYSKKNGCPPCQQFDEVYDMDKPIFAIFNIFSLGSHIEKMKEKHPFWSEHQLRCVLYWQPKARQELKAKIKKFLKGFPNFSICQTPEAMGVNLTETMAQVGIKLEWPPREIAYQIVLAGHKLNTATPTSLEKG